MQIYFYNPNIMPELEYSRRLTELVSFSKIAGFRLITEEPDTKSWVREIKDLRTSGEKSPRCWRCYEIRLEKTFIKALELDCDIVGTTLSVSPHKDADKINEAGARLSAKYGIEFLCEDFKKNNGFKRSVELSRQYGFYRQDYCGCIYSKLERDKSSGWYKKVISIKNTIKEDKSCIPINDFGEVIDLHHFHPADTKFLINEFIRQAVAKNYRSVKIIHGKGKSVKKSQLGGILSGHPDVVIFHDDYTNWGATIVKIKNPADTIQHSK